MEKSNSKNIKIGDDERERKREREQKEEQTRERASRELTKHGVAHTPLNRKLFSIHTHTHSLSAKEVPG